MASSIVSHTGSTEVSTQSAVVPVPATIPQSIKKTECDSYDEYRGAKEDLIAAGLARDDQFPRDGRLAVSYLQGMEVRKRVRMDETYLRVGLQADGTAFVCIGVAPNVAKVRRATTRASREAQSVALRAGWKQKELDEKAQQAQRNLDYMPKSEEDYRKRIFRQMRAMFRGSLEGNGASQFHGYSLTQESLDSILISFDAVAEAILGSDVLVDVQLQNAVTKKYQAAIRAADPLFYGHLDKLTQPNQAILQGEES